MFPAGRILPPPHHPTSHLAQASRNTWHWHFSSCLNASTDRALTSFGSSSEVTRLRDRTLTQGGKGMALARQRSKSKHEPHLGCWLAGHTCPWTCLGLLSLNCKMDTIDPTPRAAVRTQEGSLYSACLAPSAHLVNRIHPYRLSFQWHFPMARGQGAPRDRSLEAKAERERRGSHVTWPGGRQLGNEFWPSRGLSLPPTQVPPPPAPAHLHHSLLRPALTHTNMPLAHSWHTPRPHHSHWTPTPGTHTHSRSPTPMPFTSRRAPPPPA